MAAAGLGAVVTVLHLLNIRRGCLGLVRSNLTKARAQLSPTVLQELTCGSLAPRTPLTLTLADNVLYSVLYGPYASSSRVGRCTPEVSLVTCCWYWFCRNRWALSKAGLVCSFMETGSLAVRHRFYLLRSGGSRYTTPRRKPCTP